MEILVWFILCLLGIAWVRYEIDEGTKKIKDKLDIIDRQLDQMERNLNSLESKLEISYSSREETIVDGLHTAEDIIEHYLKYDFLIDVKSGEKLYRPKNVRTRKEITDWLKAIDRI